MVDTNCINHVAFPFFIKKESKGIFIQNNHILKVETKGYNDWKTKSLYIMLVWYKIKVKFLTKGGLMRYRSQWIFGL